VNLMTYAVAVRLQRGVVFAADTRTMLASTTSHNSESCIFGAELGIAFSCCSLPETWRSPSP
jgi:hypothetical protein